MRMYQAVLVAALVTVASGCVTSAQPIGDETPQMNPTQWNGVWLGEVGDEGLPLVVVLEVNDPQEARFTVTYTTYENEIELEKRSGVLRSLDGELFANFENRDDAGTLDGYYPLRIRREGNRLLAWELKKSVIDKMVADGTLPAGSGGAKLGPLGAESLELFAGDRIAALLDWDSPLILRRASPE